MQESAWVPEYGLKDIEVQSSTLVYDGHYQVYKIALRHKCFKRGWGPVVLREKLDRHDAASAMLYDPVRDQVVLVEQLRIGLIDRQDKPNPWMLEIVAGLIDQPGESPEATIIRESVEEAGCEIKELIPITSFYNSPGGFTELTYLYCGIIQLTETDLENQPEEDEDLKIHILKWQDAKALWESSWVTSASTYIALQWLEKNRQQLMSKYG